MAERLNLDGVESVLLRRTVLPQTAFPIELFDRVADHTWLPILGPASLALLRHVAEREGETWSVPDICSAVGLGRNARRLSEVLHRTVCHRLMEVDVSGDLAVFVAADRLPSPTPRQLRLLPSRWVQMDPAVA